MPRKKKVRKSLSAGRFGARYGVKIKREIVKIESKQKQAHVCSECNKKSLVRTAPGLYKCKSCHVKLAGGAYYPETMAGRIVRRMVLQKEFLPEIQNLLEQKTKSHELTEGKEKKTAG